MKTRKKLASTKSQTATPVPSKSMPPDGPEYHASQEEATNFNLLLFNIFYNKELRTEEELKEVWTYGVKVAFSNSTNFTDFTQEEILSNEAFEFKDVSIQKVLKAAEGFFNIVNIQDRNSKFGMPRLMRQLIDRPKEFQNSTKQELWDVYFNEIQGAANGERDPMLAAYPSNIPGSYMKKDGLNFDLDNLNNALLKVMRFYFYGAEGLTSSMKYIGSWLASFCRHLEDKNLWSTFFLFAGAEKFWEIVCSSLNDQIEAITQEELKTYTTEALKPNEKNSLKGHGCPAIMRHKAIITDPDYLKERGISTKIHVQKPGELIIIPPKVYHSGFSTGVNAGQAVNFITPETIPIALTAKECPEVSVHFPIEFLVYEYMFDCYHKYVNGKLTISDATGSCIPVPAPQLITTPRDLRQADIDQGLDAILAFKTQDGIEYAYVSIQGFKYWEERKVCEKWSWCRNSTPDKMDDNWFEFCGPQPPPYLEMGKITYRNHDDLGEIKITEAMLADIIRKTCPNFLSPNEVRVEHCSTIPNNDDQFNSLKTKTQNMDQQRKKKQNAYNELPFSCPICNKVLSSISTQLKNQKLHLKRCSLERSFVCVLCEKKYLHKSDLVHHMKNKHMISSSPNPVSLPPKKQSKKRKSTTQFAENQNKCPICNYSYDCKKGLVRHLKRKHNMIAKLVV